jgi:hypothetical protein
MQAEKGNGINGHPELPAHQKTEAGNLRREMIAEKLIGLAEGGDIAAIKYLMDRIDGRPKETVELKDSAIDIKLVEIFNDGK